MASYNDSKNDLKVYGVDDPEYYELLFKECVFNVNDKKIVMKIGYNEDSPSPVVLYVSFSYIRKEKIDVDDINENETLRNYVDVDKLVKLASDFISRFYTNVGDFVYIETEPNTTHITESYKVKPECCRSEYCNTEEGCGCCDPQRP